MKKLLRTVLLGYGLTALTSFAAQAIPLDGIAARVNDDIITQSELQQQFVLAKQQPNAPADAILKNQVLNQLIAQSLELQKAHDNKVTISDAELDAQIANIAQQNHLSVAQMQQAIVKQGVNFAEYRSNMRKQMLAERVEQMAVGGSITATPAEVQAAYAQGNPDTVYAYRVEDVVIPVANPSQTAAQNSARTLAEQTLTAWRKNPKLSPCSQNKNLQCQDLGWRGISDLPAIFAKVVPSMATGAVSGPLNAANGWHLIQLSDKKSQTAAEPWTMEEAKNVVLNRKFIPAVAKWVAQLRANADIQLSH